MGKHGSAAVARFEYAPGDALVRLQAALQAGTWQPGRFVNFAIHEPKRRWISAAPFADRVVHHALMQVVQPRFERSFIAESFANRVGLGTHRAVDALQHFSRRYRYVLRLDIRQYFQSIDHQILMQTLYARIPEPGLRQIVQRIVASSAQAADPQANGDGHLFAGDDLLALARPRGLPVGNLTSQHWSNCYLDPLDQYVRRTLGCGPYLRYVDDFALFDDDKVRLGEWRAQIVDFLARRLRLRIHENSAHVQPCDTGIPWLGFVVWPDRRRVKARKVVQATRHLSGLYRAWCRDEISFAELDASIQGWIAHVKQADTLGLRGFVLQRFALEGRTLDR